MKEPTQGERILALLRERGDRGATNFELMRIAYQYPARIHALRHREGHIIETTHVAGQKWLITLVRDADAPEVVQGTLPLDVPTKAPARRVV